MTQHYVLYGTEHEIRTDADISMPLDGLVSTSDYLDTLQLTTDSNKMFISGQVDSESGPGYVDNNLLGSIKAGRYQISGYLVLRNPQSDWKDMVPRIIKAIEHASKLCKATAPKSNEPF